ncbi:PIG-L deacetylase family protein [Kineococcus sp. SYSU DK005]|uniref:PIG-L deacetylase family protein n=1 Tax=Kineococcus sp. SYSU DK005 TaxID=3383126 RepID=UPI003D7E4767
MIVLAVVAHPDDEVLGAGATLARLAAEGHAVHILILAEGVSLRHGRLDLQQARERCRRAGSILGAAQVSFGGFAVDGGLMADAPSREVVAAVQKAIDAVGPQLVLTHHHGDIHADHRLTHHSVTYCTKAPATASVRELLTFEVLSSTEQQASGAPFTPDTFVEVGAYLDVKCAAMQVYDDECQPYPQARSIQGIRALAAVRGLHVAVHAAEAFATSRRLLGQQSPLPAHAAHAAQGG